MQIRPNNAEALHFLGVISFQHGDHKKAVELIKRAIIERPKYAEAHNNLGHPLLALRKFKGAQKHFKIAIKIREDYAEAHYNLGNTHYELNELTKAIKSYENAILINNNYLEAFFNLGNCLRDLNKLTEAVAQYKQAARVNSQYTPAHINLGGVLQKLGKYNDAILAFKKAIIINPNNAEAYYNLAVIENRCGQADSAIANYQKAININPTYDDAYNNLGNLLRQENKFHEAIVHYKKALKVTPNSVDYHFNLGMTYDDINQIEYAIEHYQEAIKLDPNFNECVFNLGLLKQTLGEIDQAIQYFQRAIEISPSTGKYFYSLSRLKKFNRKDDIKMIKDKFDNKKINAESRMFLNFTLGKVYEDCALYKKSFHHISNGNVYWRKQINYNATDTKNKFEDIKKFFNSELLQKNQRPYSHLFLRTPIFIVGMPRSGTSLVEQILSNHPQVYGAGELDLLQQLAFNQTTTPKRTDVPNSRLKQPLQKFKFPSEIKKLSHSDLNEFGATYMRNLPPESRNYQFITDKLPGNFRLIGFIKLILPNARVIHCKRDPMDTCFSAYALHFPKGQEFSFDLNELGQYYSEYSKLMNYWGLALKNWHLDIQYEDLVKSPKSYVRDILNFCGLNWDAECLNFHKSKRAVRTASANQIRKPIYKSSLQRWKKYAPYLKTLESQLMKKNK